ncbi:phage integrase [Photorhabdus luminescens]|uniref:phage integrase n=1 Tax=Photorhabdus luminescens TaxID=29488 RepID=UPI00223ED814|nr:tyrosine-type recombinase/integrase [Photorhabdus luminescens]MCW7761706.1 tyrosine-type recombinase/integrase [Photorhabdus luminescens subsp. venezuelensis]
MALTKQADGKWRLDFYPEGKKNGIGKRIRKSFTTKGEALAYERYILESVDNQPWLDSKEDRRKVSELVVTWYESHGITLDDGEKRQNAMLYACECMGDPKAVEFTTQLFSSYREKRLSGKLARTSRVSKVAPRTVNLELSYFRAMFNELNRLGIWTYDNPLKNIRPFKTEESEMAFLTNEETKKLLEECEKSRSKHLLTVVKICLSTGARWSEAEKLRASQISQYRITFTKTKGNRNRTVPISEELYNTFPKKRGSLFSSCYSAFRTAIRRTGIELPDGQLSHVLRHTFASHFMMKGGNILVLQRILGHTDIKMTMRYAHFAPDHLDDAVRLNPLAA